MSEPVRMLKVVLSVALNLAAAGVDRLQKPVVFAVDGDQRRRLALETAPPWTKPPACSGELMGKATSATPTLQPSLRPYRPAEPRWLGP